MMGNIPFRIDDEKHRKLKMRAFDYKMSMNDYLRIILDMSFEFSDEDFFKFIKANENGFRSLITIKEVVEILTKAMDKHEMDSIKVQDIISDIECLMKKNLNNKHE